MYEPQNMINYGNNAKNQKYKKQVKKGKIIRDGYWNNKKISQVCMMLVRIMHDARECYLNRQECTR